MWERSREVTSAGGRAHPLQGRREEEEDEGEEEQEEEEEAEEEEMSEWEPTPDGMMMSD